MDTHQYISECLTNLVFFSDSPQVRYLVTGSESGSESESESENTDLLVPSSGRCTTAVGSQRISIQFRTLYYSYAVRVTHVASRRITIIY